MEYGKIDFRKAYGTLFCSLNHEYIQLYRYYDIIKKMTCRSTMTHSIILHDHLSRAACDRMPSKWGQLFIRINSEKEKITNKEDLRDFFLQEGYMKTNAKHLLDFSDPIVWYKAFKQLKEIGLIEARTGRITPMVPIQGRFLPINYAYVAFLSRLKKDSELRKSITESLSKIPEKIKEELEKYEKDDLIKEIIHLKTKNIETHKDSPIYKMLYDDISRKYPHKFGEYKGEDSQKKKNFLDEVLKGVSDIMLNKEQIKLEQRNDPDEIFPEIQPDKTAQAIKLKEKKKPTRKTVLNVDDIHRFEKGKLTKNTKKTNEPNNPETQIFYGVTPDILIDEPEKEIDLCDQEDIEEFEIFEFEEDSDNVDLFGIPLSEPETEFELPEKIKKEKDFSDFWS